MLEDRIRRDALIEIAICEAHAFKNNKGATSTKLTRQPCLSVGEADAFDFPLDSNFPDRSFGLSNVQTGRLDKARLTGKLHLAVLTLKPGLVAD